MEMMICTRSVSECKEAKAIEVSVVQLASPNLASCIGETGVSLNQTDCIRTYERPKNELEPEDIDGEVTRCIDGLVDPDELFGFVAPSDAFRCDASAS